MGFIAVIPQFQIWIYGHGLKKLIPIPHPQSISSERPNNMPALYNEEHRRIHVINSEGIKLLVSSD